MHAHHYILWASCCGAFRSSELVVVWTKAREQRYIGAASKRLILAMPLLPLPPPEPFPINRILYDAAARFPAWQYMLFVPTYTSIFSISAFLSLSVSLPFCLCVSLPVSVSLCLSLCLSACLSLCLSACLCVSLPVSVSLCLSLCLSACLCLYLCLSFSICLPVSVNSSS